MQMLPGGIDVFYIDESHDQNLYVVTALAIPLLRPEQQGWRISWRDFFEATKIWRKGVANSSMRIPMSKELHGVQLARGRGKFFKGKYNFGRPRATGVYRQLLRSLTSIPDGSVMSASATNRGNLYGRQQLEAALYALFQRMRTQCARRNVNAMVFFDQGHPEYRRLYRQAQVFLSTGSSIGGWESGGTSRNMPLDMFFKDGNEKNSKHCRFTQIADLIAYAAFLKCKHELGQLTPWQASYNLGALYDEVPRAKINLAVTNKTPKDGIVRLQNRGGSPQGRPAQSISPPAQGRLRNRGDSMPPPVVSCTPQHDPYAGNPSKGLGPNSLRIKERRMAFLSMPKTFDYGIWWAYIGPSTRRPSKP
jgi:Protein of unknown function (DUF3800)